MPTNVVTLEQLFKDQVFRIPNYQRGYAWEPKHVAELLEDLDLLPPGKRHYGGTIVLMPTKDVRPAVDEEGVTNTIYDVVDGQQRLTTSVLILDAIRHEIEAVLPRDPRAAGIRSRFISWRDRSGTVRPRLRTQPEAQNFWQHTVLGLEPAAADAPRNLAERRLLAAKVHVRRHLGQLRVDDAHSYVERLMELRDTLATRWDLSLYEVSDEGEVGVIFEVMNDRGKPLTELEKTKNYLMYLDTKLDLEDHELDDLVNEEFAEIYRELLRGGLAEPADEDRLLRSHWVATVSGSFRTPWDGARTVKATFGLRSYQGRHKELLADVSSYVRSLRAAAVAYADLSTADAQAFGGLQVSDRETLLRASDRLKRLGLRAPMLPLLIAGRLAAGADGDAYLRLLDACERFVARVYELGGWRAHTARSQLADLALTVQREGDAAIAEAAERIDALSLGYVDDQKFVGLLNGEFGWHFPVNYLLTEYEVHLCRGGYVPMFDAHANLSVEHILPQHPRDPCWLDVFSDEDRQALTEDLGNKCLTADFANPAMSNRCYTEKVGAPGIGRACYAKSDHRQERELYDRWPTAWTPDTIRERRAAIVEWAVHRWATAGQPEETMAPETPVDSADDEDDDA